jgi:hypothetical protein
MPISNEFILIIMLIQFLFIMYQISCLKKENFESTSIESQIATFYQADIASIQALGAVAKALITGGNTVPGNLTINGDLNIKSKLNVTSNTTLGTTTLGNTTINGNLTAPNIVSMTKFTNGLGLSLGQRINLQSNISSNNVADTISTGSIWDATSLCIVGHGTGSGNEDGPRKIHLWDNVVIDNDLNVKSNITAGKSLSLANWSIYADNNFLNFYNNGTNQGVRFQANGGCQRIQPMNGDCAGMHTRFQ